jgi:hypothetical protein
VTCPSQEALWRRASGKWDAADNAATEAAAATARVRILQQVGNSLYAAYIQDRAYTVFRQHHKHAMPSSPCPVGDTLTTLFCIRDISQLPAGC